MRDTKVCTVIVALAVAVVLMMFAAPACRGDDAPQVHELKLKVDTPELSKENLAWAGGLAGLAYVLFGGKRQGGGGTSILSMLKGLFGGGGTKPDIAPTDDQIKIGGLLANATAVKALLEAMKAQGAPVKVDLVATFATGDPITIHYDRSKLPFPVPQPTPQPQG